MSVSPRMLFALKVALSVLILLQTFLLILVVTLLQLSHAVAIVLMTGIAIDAMALFLVFRATRGQRAEP